MKITRYVKLFLKSLPVGVASALLTVAPVLIVQHLVQQAINKVPVIVDLPWSANAVLGLGHAPLFAIALMVASLSMTIASVVYARQAKRRNRVVPAWVHG